MVKWFSRKVWFMVNIAVGMATVGSAFCGLIAPDHHPAVAQVVNMAFPLCVGVMIALGVVSAFVCRKALWVALVALGLAWSPLLDQFPLNLRGVTLTTQQSERAFTVMTYNTLNFIDLAGSGDTSQTLDNIISANPDIVCIQEGANITGRRHGVGTAAQRDTIRRRYPYIISTPRLAGEILLSRFPARLLPVDQPSEGSGKYCAYMLDIPGLEPTLLINCHLQSIGLTPADKATYRELTDHRLCPTRRELSNVKHALLPKLTAAFRERALQARSIKAYIDSMAIDNVILAGDFNDVVGSYAYRTIRSCGLTDAYAHCALGPTYTYHASKFYFRIDHIFYRGQMQSVKIERGNSPSSDHYSLMATMVPTPSLSEALSNK